MSEVKDLMERHAPGDMPSPVEFREAFDSDFNARRHERIRTMPRIVFVCGRDWSRPDGWELGAMWSKKPNADEGEMIYRHRAIMRLRFSISFDFALKRSKRA